MFDFNGGNNDNRNAHFLDDSILFSQKSNFDPTEIHEISAPFTPANKTNRDNNFTNLLNSHAGWSIEENPSKEQIINMVKYTNHTLKSFGFLPLGDLTSNKDDEAQKTLNCVYGLIQQRIRDIEFRKDILEKLAKTESDKAMYMQNIERLKQETLNLSKEVGLVKNNSYQHEKKCKSEREKLISEKEDLVKQLTKANQKHVQYQHEMRKKEVEVNRVKEQMRKPMLEKGGSNKHFAEIYTSSNVAGFTQRQNAENELTQMTNNSIDNHRAKLLTENQELRNMLSYFQNELSEIMKEKKEEFVKRRLSEVPVNTDEKALKHYYESFFSDADLIIVKSGIYQMPMEKIGNDLMQIFKENFKIFRKFWTKILTVSYPPEFFKDISKDLIDIDQNFAKVKSFIDLKKALTGLRKKWGENVVPTRQSMGGALEQAYNSLNHRQSIGGNDPAFSTINNRKSLMGTESFTGLNRQSMVGTSELIMNTIKGMDHDNIENEIADLVSNSNLGPDVLGGNQENIPNLSNETFNSKKNLSPIRPKYMSNPNPSQSNPLLTTNNNLLTTTKNENEQQPELSTRELEEKFNELMNFNKPVEDPSSDQKPQYYERRKMNGEINRWKNALHSRGNDT